MQLFAIVLSAFLYVFWMVASVIIPATEGTQLLTTT
jgi:hypothetical protein